MPFPQSALNHDPLALNGPRSTNEINRALAELDAAVEALKSTTFATIDINGGTIDGTVIGGTTPANGTFDQLVVSNSTLARHVFRDPNAGVGYKNGQFIWADGSLTFQHLDDADGLSNNTLTIQNGKVGINNAAPTYPFDHVGDTRLAGALRVAGVDAVLELENNAAAVGSLEFNSSGELEFDSPIRATGQLRRYEDGGIADAVLESYGAAQTDAPNLVAKRAQGSKAASAAPNAFDDLFRLSIQGYEGGFDNGFIMTAYAAEAVGCWRSWDKRGIFNYTQWINHTSNGFGIAP